MAEQRFDDRVAVRLPASIPQAVKRAAARRGQKDSEYVRAALVSALKADGIAFTVRDVTLVDDGTMVRLGLAGA